MGPGMSPALRFQQLFGRILARQVEYSYDGAEDRLTTMVPLRRDRLPQVVDLAKESPFAGDWAWSVERFAAAARPDELLFRLDWLRAELTALTLYCRFPSEPGDADFRKAIGVARSFTWSGPEPSAVATSLGVAGPRGIAFRATSQGDRRSSVYFRCEQHAGAAWTDRLSGLLDACRYPRELAPTIEGHLRELYAPGPVGVIGVDDGRGGVAGALKFDPSNVPLGVAFAFLARVGVPAARILALRNVAVGLRANAATYVGVQYGPEGFAGFRLYFACEPGYARMPGRIAVSVPRRLRPVRRLPHY
jgi:hypothetical protein